jgi:hypothetical protein
MKKTGLDFDSDMLSIPNLASAICSATSLAHAVLLKSVIVRYFAHHQTLKLTASEFARGYACLVWALCKCLQVFALVTLCTRRGSLDLCC